MRAGNALVRCLLGSRLHRMASGALVVIRYTGRRTGRQHSTPVQYAEHDGEMIVLVGRPDTKTWWRNFTDPQPAELLMRRRWVPVTARAVLGSDDPDAVGPLLDVYLQRFPKAARVVGGVDPEARTRNAVVVRCTPR